MKHDMITVFNQLTSSELADCNLFRNLLSDHFLKFRYFYELIEGLDLRKVDRIQCEDKQSFISVCIIPKDSKHINDVLFTINRNKRDSQMANYFTTYVGEVDSKIFIDIELCDFVEEGDIYNADRFI